MTRVRRHFCLVPFVVLSTIAAARGENAAGHRVDAALLDTLYDRRAEPGALDDLIARTQRTTQIDPDNYDATWRLARAWSWRGYTAADREERRRAAETALELGRRAISLAPNRVEGYFAFAIAAGVYADAIGVAQAFVRQVGPDFERAMKRAVELDRHFDDGSPMVALGRYYYELPWPLRDLQQSVHLLEEATASHPRSLRAHLYLAETYYDMRRPTDARRELDVVLRTISTDAAAAAALRQTARANMKRWFGESQLATASE